VARILIDTNVVLSHLIDRNPQQHAKAVDLISSAKSREHDLIVHQAVVSEAVYVLTHVYAVDTEVVAAIVRELLSAPGIIPINDVSWTTLLALWPEDVSDFGDACLAAAAKTARIDAVATFDAGFAQQLRRLDLATYWR